MRTPSAFFAASASRGKLGDTPSVDFGAGVVIELGEEAR